MQIFYLILCFIFGALFGSFYTVVGLRLEKKESFMRGRSHCDLCNHPLKATDLIPLFSFLFLKGKCRYCKKKISPLSTVIEFSSGLLFMIAYYSFGLSLDFLLMLLVISMTMIIIVSDLSYFVIPDEVLLVFGILIFIVQIFREGIILALVHVATGIFLFLCMYGLMVLGKAIFKKDALGGGDVKLLFIFGLLLDPILGLLTIFLGSFIALPVSLLLLLKNKDHMIPFGPFLLVALLIILFSKITPQDFLSFFFI